MCKMSAVEGGIMRGAEGSHIMFNSMWSPSLPWPDLYSWLLTWHGLGSHTACHNPHAVLLKLAIKLCPVALLTLYSLLHQFNLHLLHLFRVSTLSTALRVQCCLDVLGHPGFINGETAHCLCY